MSGRVARQRRAVKEAHRQYRERTPRYVQLDQGFWQIFRQFAAAMVQDDSEFSQAMFRLSHHVPWVDLPPGGLRHRRLTGKPGKF